MGGAKHDKYMVTALSDSGPSVSVMVPGNPTGYTCRPDSSCLLDFAKSALQWESIFGSSPCSSLQARTTTYARDKVVYHAALYRRRQNAPVTVTMLLASKPSTAMRLNTSSTRVPPAQAPGCHLSLAGLPLVHSIRNAQDNRIRGVGT